jgi:peptide/nickel transport system substrate-binding protein
MKQRSHLGLALVAVVLAGTLVAGSALAQPRGQVTYAMHVTIAAAWFDPAENTGIATPFMVQEAMHDALAKPMPQNLMAPSLAESWSQSPDGLTYDFVLRKGVPFHNGDLVTAEDVKFSFERYRGAGAKILKAKVKAVQAVGPQRVRFVLHEAWPDFLTFYATPATGAGWIVPKKYVEQAGDDGFKRHPIGAGPYKFVRYQPGVELILEAHERYWRKPPHVKRLVMKVVPDESTRLAMLKRGEADIAYLLSGAIGEEARRTPNIRLVASGGQWVPAICMLDQWEPKSPWHDVRVRRAASHAIDRKAISDSETLGASPPVGSIIPPMLEFALPVETPRYDPAKARQLLREAGYPTGFDAGEMVGTVQYAGAAEAVINDFGAVGIRARFRTMERAAYLTAQREKKLKNLLFCGAGGYGNAATRIENYLISSGSFAYGAVPDIDDLFTQQAREPDRGKRQALLHRIQQIATERVLYIPLYMLSFHNGVGPRVQEPSLGRIALHYYTAPFEDIRLKDR